jgi:hypothetical protein
MMQAVPGLASLYTLHPLAIPQSLRQAVLASAPDLIVPTDDTAVWLLHELAQSNPEFSPLIERSLGSPEHFSVLRSRRQFLALAQSLGIPCPQTARIESPSAIHAIVARNEFPAVLKYDGTSGGYGVVLARNPDQLQSGYRMLLRYRLPLRNLKRFLINGDATALHRSNTFPPDEITRQSFIPGTAANGLFVAQRGQILAHIQVGVVRTLSETGASVIVDRIDHPAILDAAEKLAAHLQLSGILGLDFILHADTGEPHLLEINPRATQLCHIPLNPAQNTFATLTDAIYFVASGNIPQQPSPLPVHNRFAFFPQVLTLPSDDPALATATVDRPDEPALVAELERPVWPQRRPWLRLYNRILRRIDERPGEFADRLTEGQG